MSLPIEYVCNFIANTKVGGPPPFEKEDAELMRMFGLHKLRDSYAENTLVPEDISQAVGNAYAHIQAWGKAKKERYISESSLGRKLQLVIDHDRDFIHNFCHPLYEQYTQINPSDALKEPAWKPKLKAEATKGKSAAQVKALEKLAEDCQARLNRYVSKNLPKEWG